MTAAAAVNSAMADPPGGPATAVCGAATPSALCGLARAGRRTKELVHRLDTGAVAILEHPDLDTVAAAALVRRRPVAVVNTRLFTTGRYPTLGPEPLLAAGVPLFEVVPGGAAADLFDRVSDGEPVYVAADGTLRAVDGALSLARLTPFGNDDLYRRYVEACAHVDAAIAGFARNTLHYLNSAGERALLTARIAVPRLRTGLAGRVVLVVVRGAAYERDLQALLPFIRSRRPVVLAVDGAADALLDAGVRPDLVLGDMDSASDAALGCGAELVVHGYRRSDAEEAGKKRERLAPGLTRVHALGLSAVTFAVAGTSEDAALLLAFEAGAEQIIAIGTHTGLEDFLDKGRDGMASSFLTRLRVGSRLVDARGIAALLCENDGAASEGSGR